MKTIIIATDFSPCAHNAARYGLELANAMGMHPVLLHVYNVPLTIPESYVLVTPEQVKKTAEDYLQEEVTSLEKQSDHTIQTAALEGNVVDAILAFADEYEDSMLLVGMKGEAGAIRKTFGSTATGLARKTGRPLLIIPENADFRPLNKMALAAEETTQTDIHAVSVIRTLGDVFHSKVFVVKVLKTELSAVDEHLMRSDAFASLLRPLDVEHHFPLSKNVTMALDDFSEENQVDLLAVIPHHHSFIERLFIRSETRKLIFHTRIPLLVLPEKVKPSLKKNEKLQRQLS